MARAPAGKPDFEKDIRELAQAVATLEIVIVWLGVFSLSKGKKRRKKFVATLQELSDTALYERDGLEPHMLERIAEFVQAFGPLRH